MSALAELRKEAPPGAERVLRAMVRRGLPVEAFGAACRLVAELEEVCQQERRQRASARRST